MSRQDKLNDSREGLLSAQEDVQLWASSEEAYESSSELGQELDELDPLNGEKQEYIKPDGQRRRPRLEFGVSPLSYKSSKHSQLSSLLRELGRCLWPRSTCLLIAVILIVGSLLVIGGGGLWVYKTTPPDGVGHLSSIE